MFSRIPLHNFTAYNFTNQGNKPQLDIVETLNRVLSINLKDQKLGIIDILDFSALEFIYIKLYLLGNGFNSSSYLQNS